MSANFEALGFNVKDGYLGAIRSSFCHAVPVSGLHNLQGVLQRVLRISARCRNSIPETPTVMHGRVRSVMVLVHEQTMCEAYRRYAKHDPAILAHCEQLAAQGSHRSSHLQRA
jgi:hypothetical protein